jgi:Ca-activated chloride channel homolog
VGIDQAVNAGFLGRLAGLGGGRCELVESEDRLDEATDRIHQRIGAPLLTGVRVRFEDGDPSDLTPARAGAIFPGAPLVLRGRLATVTAATVTAAVVTGTTHTGDPYELRVPATRVTSDALTPVWARARLRDLEDEYAVGAGGLDELEKRIVAISLQYGVLCRFTAFVAVDSRVVTDGSGTHRVTQPVELPAGWEPTAIPAAAPMMAPMAMRTAAAMPPPAPAGGSIGGATLYSMNAPEAESAAAAVPPFAKLHGRRDAAPGTDSLDAVRRSLAAEAARLRAIEAADEPTKRLALADLATRLYAVLRQLPAPDADPRTARLRRLATDLAACDTANPPRGADLTALYDRALALLTAFEQAATPEDPGQRSRANFWKRG